MRTAASVGVRELAAAVFGVHQISVRCPSRRKMDAGRRTLTPRTGWCVPEVIALFASWRLLEMSPCKHSLLAMIGLSKQKHRLQKAEAYHFLFSDVLVSSFSPQLSFRIQIQFLLLISLLLSSPSSFLSPNSSSVPHRFSSA